MRVSIVIVNFRAWQHLRAAMDALLPGLPDDWEVIVVDNESEPGPFAEFESAYPRLRMIANEANSGFGYGSNIGAATAGGDWLLFMNPDVVATVDDIRALLNEMSTHPDVAILAPRQVDTGGRAQKVFDEFPGALNQSRTLKSLARLLSPRRSPDPHAEHRELVYCDWVTGSVLLIRRSDFESLGGWSADFWMYAEDADLCRRAADRGMKVAYTPSVSVVHAHGGSSRINVAVKAMTKLEVIISKHVYVSRHIHGLRGLLAHGMIVLTRVPPIAIGALADLLTLRRVPALRVRGRMFGNLLRYYAGAIGRRTWRSERALANIAQAS